ncbi:cytochrome P450 [Thermoactinospora rubra]|uniref:cytochrome P450 n=1 Tax=Thermoactinospora rubra TaxID=1088767 RepID=UPI0013020352|nr:cytochrome P450 [Thermoactinospora rubra]
MLPPGPKMPPLLQTVWFMANPTRAFARCRERYGPVFTLRLAGFPPDVLVAKADLAELVYRTDQGGGHAGAARRDFLEHAVGRHSLLTLDDDPWWAHRRLITPPLRGRAIAGYADQIAAIAAERIATWPLGEPFALREKTQEITLEVILRLVFGIPDDRLRALLPELLELGGATSVLMAPPRLRPLLPKWRRFLKVRAAVDRILYEHIAERRAEPDSVLHRLFETGMSDQELRDELITLLEAGHETTATALAWAFERLLRTPGLLAKVTANLDDDDYLDAVAKEALRIRPVVYSAERLLTAPLRLGDYEVPAGWYAGPLISLIHHDPEEFPAPEEFRPERFLEGRTPKGWMPFGGGRRFCVGAQLALMEMRVIIREVLRRLELTAPDPAPEAQRMKHVTLVPSKLARVSARARTPARAT